MRIKKDTPVKLKTFLGTLTSPIEVEEKENYWKLIGERGKVIDDKKRICRISWKRDWR